MKYMVCNKNTNQNIAGPFDTIEKANAYIILNDLQGISCARSYNDNTVTQGLDPINQKVSRNMQTKQESEKTNGQKAVTVLQIIAAFGGGFSRGMNGQ